MEYRTASEKLAAYRKEIAGVRAKMRALQATVEPHEVRDYELAGAAGPVRLSALFGAKRELFLIHNMGRSCPNCTMWADGFNGLYPHLADRGAFVVSSPDPPEVQKAFAASRGWRFPMVSHRGTSFAADMGYASESGGWLPGISVFRHDGARIWRVADTRFDQGDDFCPVWHILDLLPEGPAGWRAKFEYPE
jgi:predicted dithiol-disulfide oxidoreductase (DUF899 family)